MTDDGQEAVQALLADYAAIIRQHLRDYLETDGAIGYIQDNTGNGGTEAMLNLVLRTVGRRSGREILVPLLYAAWADEYVIVASKGGADAHPAWYLNLVARPEVEWQVLGKRFSGTWRVAEGAERATLWDYVSRYYGAYATYQTRTERVMPIIVLTPTARIEERWSLTEESEEP